MVPIADEIFLPLNGKFSAVDLATFATLMLRSRWGGHDATTNTVDFADGLCGGVGHRGLPLCAVTE